MAARPAVELIADAHDEGQHEQVGQKAQDGVADGPDGKDDGGDEDGDGDDHEQKAGAAPGVVPGLSAHVLHRQGQTGLVAEDGLVLRPVVGKDPLHLPHPGAQGQIADQNGQLQQALGQIPHQHGVGHQGDGGAQQGGQQEKQPDGHPHAQNHRQGDEKGGGLVAAQLVLQPGLELGGLFLLVVLREELGGVHQGGHAVVHGAAEAEHPPDEGPAHHGAAVLQRVQLLHLDLQLPVGPAHHHRLLPGAAHHDPLDEGLPSAHGFEALGAGRPSAGGGLLCLFVFHKNGFSLCSLCLLYQRGGQMASGRPTARWAGGW